MNPFLRWSSSLLLAGGLSITAGCESEPEGSTSPGTASEPGNAAAAGTGASAGEEAASVALLELAFDAASALPDLHVKTRSRLQQELVAASLGAGEAALAGRFAGAITNWRQGLALASIALHHAEAGRATAAEPPLAAAIAMVERLRREGQEQKWRWDRIRAHVAAALIELGRDADAAPFAADLEPSEVGPVMRARMRTVPADRVDDQLDQLQESLAVRDFELTRASYASAAELYRRHYARPEVRDRVETMVRGSTERLAGGVVVSVFCELARGAIENEDSVKALELVTDAERAAAEREWLPRDAIPMRATFARLRAQAGDAAGAEKAAGAALELYREQEQAIVDIRRADALAPLAEAFHAAGADDRAGDVYATAADALVVNPNSVPRAEDLCGVVSSMVLNGFTPTASLRARLVRIRDELGDPW